MSALSDLKNHNSRLHEDSSAAAPHYPYLQSVAAVNIFRACARGDLEQVKGLLESGADINAFNSDKEGSFPLYLAEKSGHIDLCRYLLDQGAAVDAQCKVSKKTALHASVSNDDIGITSLLVSRYAPGGYIHHRDSHGQSPIGIAFKKNFTNVLAVFSAEVRLHKECKRIDCLAASTMGGKKKITSFVAGITRLPLHTIAHLIDHSCIDFNYATKHTSLPFHLVLTHGHDSLAHQMLQTGRVNVNKVNPLNGFLPLYTACGSVAAAPLLRELIAMTQFPLVDNRQPQSLIWRLLGNTDLFKTDSEEPATSLLSEIVEAVGEEEVQSVNGSDQSPLHFACEKGYIGAVKLLAPKTRFIDRRDLAGWTPLHLTVYKGEANILEITDTLLQHMDTTCLRNRTKLNMSLAESAALRPNPIRGALLERLFWKYRPIETGLAASAATFLHFGAWALDETAVRKSIADDNASVNLSAHRLPEAWELNLQVKTPDIDCPVAREIFSTPLLLAFNTELQDPYQTSPGEMGKRVLSRRVTRNTILRLILECEPLDLSELFQNVQERYQVLLVRILAQASGLGMAELLAARGVTLPWQLMSWTCLPEWEGKLDVEVIFIDEHDAATSTTNKMIVEQPLILAVLSGGRCRLVDVFKANFELACRIIHWEFDGRLDLAGCDGILMQIYELGGETALKRMLRLGVGGTRPVFWGAVRTGNQGLVNLLVEAGTVFDELESVDDESGLAAYQLALQGGHPETAEAPRAWSVYLRMSGS
ncbi:ankyrin repeat-containing domain protein [Podospora aff. communis PSN243]|uniref:Ankyrin repeat-containing domain protein n=1 Tax=Podospora aff. communis PSN243 TaxID=3040156 RepID=A0AAV9GH80_9PEZI|nr:ankyrin repeat-containing domain protein [Podospora aff. communis PSN243]